MYDLNHRKKELKLESPSSNKKITRFNSKLYSEDDIEFNDIINPNISLFPHKKFKKTYYSSKNNENINETITFIHGNNKQFIFPLYGDKDIFEKNDIINKCNIEKEVNVSDDEEIQSNYNSCLFELSKAINYIKNNPNFFEDKINNRKKCF